MTDCQHTQITEATLVEADRLATKYAESSFYWITCPDCGWKGYPYFDEDTATVVFAEEPRGAGDSVAW